MSKCPLRNSAVPCSIFDLPANAFLYELLWPSLAMVLEEIDTITHSWQWQAGIQ
jgi:hypothetical protein